MRRTILAALALQATLLFGQPVRIAVEAPGQAGQQATLYRYMDLFTNRLEPLATARMGAQGQVSLQAEVARTTKAQLRIGDVTANLWLRPGDLVVELDAQAQGQRRLPDGTTRVNLLFKDLDLMNVNALMSDLNMRLDEFTAARAMGQPDSTGQFPYNAPDTFATKLRSFYQAVDDPWFQHNVDYGLANLEIQPKARDRILFKHYLEGKPVLYDVPEYSRFITTFFKDYLLRQPFRTNTAELLHHIREGHTDSLKALLARNDFLKDDRLNELVLITNLYYDHAHTAFDRAGLLAVLGHVHAHSAYPEHRLIAGNMLWELTAMTAGTPLPPTTLLDRAGQPVATDSLLHGDACLILARMGNTFNEKELLALNLHYEEYAPYLRFVHVLVGGGPQQLDAWLNAHGKPPGTWLVPQDERGLLDSWRIAQLPLVLLLKGDTMEVVPAPLPSAGLAAELHRIKARKMQRIQEQHRRGARPATRQAP